MTLWLTVMAAAPDAPVEDARRALQRQDPVKALTLLQQAGAADPAKASPRQAAVLALAAAGAGDAARAEQAWNVVRQQALPPLAALAVDARFLGVCPRPCKLPKHAVAEVLAAPLLVQARYLQGLARSDPAAAKELAGAVLGKGAFRDPAWPAGERAELLASVTAALEAGKDPRAEDALLAAWESLPMEPALAFVLRSVDEQEMVKRHGAAHAVARLEGLTEARRNREVVLLGTSLCAGNVLLQGTPCPALEPGLACRVAFAVGKAQRQLRKPEEGEQALRVVAARCPELAERALFLGARAAIAQLGGGTRALPLLDRLVKDYPRSNLADDALVLAGETAARLEQPDVAAAYWKRAEQDYPDADLAGQARWWLAWTDAEAGRLAAAQQRLEVVCRKTVDADPVQWRRAAYWRARLSADPAVQRAGLEDVARREPLSFEASLARGVLRRQGAAVPEVPVVVKPVDMPAVPLGPQGEAGLALARLGLDEDAAVVLRQWLAGFARDSTADLVVAQALLDAGDPATASRWLRKNRDAELHGPPSTTSLRTWQLAYPRAHAGAIESAARTMKLPSALLFALAREESAFDARVTSLSGAVGLFQLVPPTALTEAMTLKIPVENEAALHDPDLNAHLGASYLARMGRQFHGNVALALSGYNAGPGFTHKWLQRAPDERLDFYVERIPVAETRDYVKRVLESYTIYAWLQDGTLLEFPEHAADRMVAP